MTLNLYPFTVVSIVCVCCFVQEPWPTDLAVLGSSPARGEIFLTVHRVPLHTAFHFSSAHRPDMTEILLKRTQNSKSSIHSSSSLCLSISASFSIFTSNYFNKLPKYSFFKCTFAIRTVTVYIKSTLVCLYCASLV